MPRGVSLANFKAVLFDVDGTLVDTLPALIRGLGDSYEHFNGRRPSDDDIRATIGTPLFAQMQMFTDAALNEKQIQERILYTISRYEAHAELERAFPAAIKALQLIKSNGLKIALVTSKNALEIELFSKRAHWIGTVDTVITASDVSHPKPHPESAVLACERLGVQPGEAVFIGDSVYDMQCGRAAGTSIVAVGYGSGKTQALLEQAPDMFINTPENLLDWAKETILTPCLEGRI